MPDTVLGPGDRGVGKTQFILLKGFLGLLPPDKEIKCLPSQFFE